MNYRVKQVNEVLGFDIREKTNKRKYVYPRRIAAKLMQDDGLSLKHIAKELHLNTHDQIIKYLDTFCVLTDYYLNIYNSLKHKPNGLSNLDLRVKFNKAFNLPITEKPSLIDSDRSNFQIKLIKEKLSKYDDACFDEDITEITETLTDIQDVLYGMFADHGVLHLHDKLYTEIHHSNMTKLSPQKKVIYNKNGKIVKFGHFVKPDISKVLGI